jgi:hypothetical protein
MNKVPDWIMDTIEALLVGASLSAVVFIARSEPSQHPGINGALLGLAAYIITLSRQIRT